MKRGNKKSASSGLVLGVHLLLGVLFFFQPAFSSAADEYEHLKIGLPRDIASIDPLGYPGLSRPELNVQMCFFDHLFRRAESGEIVPHLASGYKWLDDNTVRISLRKGVTFHDGSPFTAADVKWSIEDMLDPQRGPALVGFVTGIAKVSVVDDFTVDLQTKEPFPTLLSRLTCYTPMVSSKQRTALKPEVYEKNPIGTGPFKFIQWKKGEIIEMERYEQHWRGVPKIKKLSFYPIADQNTRVSALKSGTIDIAMDISPSMAKELKRVSNIEVTATPSARCEWVWLRTDKPPFNDKRVRQALNYAVNKEEFVQSLQEGYGLPLGQPLPPYFFGHNPDIKPYPYDPEKAKKLLAEAGVPKNFTVSYETSADWQERARAVAGYFQAVGINCKIEVKEHAAAYADLLERKMTPIFHWNWGNWSLMDIDGTLQFVFGCTKPDQGKWSYYCDPRVEKLIQDLKTVDEEKRKALSKQAMELLHEEAPVVYLYAHYDIHAKRTGIPEFKARVDNTIWVNWIKGE